MLANCRSLCLHCCCLCFLTACKLFCLKIADPFAYAISAFGLPIDCKPLCLQTADPFAYSVSAFAFSQGVSALCLQIADPFAYAVLPLPSHRVWVIVLADCRSHCLCCFCLYLLTAYKWLCLHTADPFAHAVCPFAIPQVVSDCACPLQNLALRFFLSLLCMFPACMSL